MRFLALVVGLTIVLVPASAALAGRAKPGKPAARKAETTKKRSARVVLPSSGECTRVVLEDVPLSTLRLVGIVGAGRLQKALLMDADDEATTIMRGDCLGIERASYDDVVKPLVRRKPNA